MKNIRSIVKEFIKVVIIVAVAVPMISLFAAWTEPTAAPTGGNAAAPVNVGAVDQIKIYEIDESGNLIPGKSGGLMVGSFISRFTTLLATAGGNVGIGQRDWTVNPPMEKLDVAGTVKMTGFQLGTLATEGQVLTTNAQGIGSWRPLVGGSVVSTGLYGWCNDGQRASGRDNMVDFCDSGAPAFCQGRGYNSCRCQAGYNKVPDLFGGAGFHSCYKN